MVAVPQDMDWHPEGCVWEHTCHVVDAMAWGCNDITDPDHRVKLVFAALCHDMGKPAVTVFSDGRFRSPGHDSDGEQIAFSFMERLFHTKEQKAPSDITEFVVTATGLHMRHLGFIGSQPQVRRLATKINLHDLKRVVEADINGRPFVKGEWVHSTEMNHIISVAEMINVLVQRPCPIFTGKHLVEIGMKPSKAFKPLLESMFENQMDGAFDDISSALIFFNENYNSDGGLG